MCLINTVFTQSPLVSEWNLVVLWWNTAEIAYTHTDFSFLRGKHTMDVSLCWAPCPSSVMFQSILGAEGLSLAFRHIVSSLLWYCSQHSAEELLHEVIICVGYFTVNHAGNQVKQHELRHMISLVMVQLKMSQRFYIRTCVHLVSILCYTWKISRRRQCKTLKI